MDEKPQDWRQDRWLWAALIAALLVRIVPMIIWQQGDCVRDECIYRAVATRIIDGEGLTTTSKGWLPAPGYPYLLALMKAIFGAAYAVKFVQIGLSLISVVLIYLIGERLDGRKVGRIVCWMFALHPTLAFFAQTLWIETIYIFFLLFAILGVLWSRDGEWKRALGPGALLGLATLFRGVATYLPPIFALAILWPRGGFTGLDSIGDAVRARWKHALALMLAWAVVIAPYSIHGSRTHGGFMITDATVGHVLFLGNNDFPPLTFDYGNGMLSGPLYAKYLKRGRRPCDRNELPVASSKCEVGRAKNWITEHPREFVDRIPVRLAQLMNPHSFFTRHLRWGAWLGMPWWIKEFLVAATWLTSVAIMVGGTLGAWGRAKGPFGVMAGGTVLYTTTTVAIMYGMTRFRLPLEPLWMLYLAMFIAHPGEVWKTFQEHTWRAAGALVTLPVLLVLIAWYLPTGYPALW